MLPLHIDSLLTCNTISFIILDPVMSSDDQKRFERFIYLALPKFSGAIREDAYEFLLDYHEKSNNFRSLESYKVSFMIYQLNDMVVQLEVSF